MVASRVALPGSAALVAVVVALVVRDQCGVAAAVTTAVAAARAVFPRIAVPPPTSRGPPGDGRPKLDSALLRAAPRERRGRRSIGRAVKKRRSDFPKNGFADTAAVPPMPRSMMSGFVKKSVSSSAAARLTGESEVENNDCHTASEPCSHRSRASTVTWRSASERAPMRNRRGGRCGAGKPSAANASRSRVNS